MTSKTIPIRTAVAKLPGDVINRGSGFAKVVNFSRSLGAWLPIVNTYSEAKAMMAAIASGSSHKVKIRGYITSFSSPSGQGSTTATIKLVDGGGYISSAWHLYYTAVNTNLNDDNYQDIGSSDLWIFYVDHDFDDILDPEHHHH